MQEHVRGKHSSQKKKKHTLGVLEIVAPQGANLVLTSDVPHGEADVLVLDCLHVESYSEGVKREVSGEWSGESKKNEK